MPRELQNTPKGWFFPSGLFVKLNWSRDLDESNYLSYLATFGHEQFHYLQHIGTSFGQFLADLEDIWINCIIDSVCYGLEKSNNRILSLNEWAENETKNSVKEVLDRCIKIYEICKRINEIFNVGGSNSTLREFSNLYLLLLEYQLNNPKPIWFVDPEKMPIDPEFEFLSRGYSSSSSVMECVVAFWQLQFIGNVDPKLNELSKLPENIQLGLVNERGKKACSSRVEDSLLGEYTECYYQISGYLPADIEEAVKILYIITDLALMPPIGRFNSVPIRPLTFADLLPSIRLFKAAEAVSRLGITITDVNEDYSKIVSDICVDLGWPQPEWIAIKSPRLSVKRDEFEYKAISELQSYANRYRILCPSAFAYPRAPLINEMRVPIIYYTDGVKMGVPEEVQISLMARYFKKLCAETWVLGKKPEFPEISFPEISDFSIAYESAFYKIFGITIEEVEL